MKAPLVVSIGSKPKGGKTTFAAKFPHAFIIDFASVNMGLAHDEVLEYGDVGEAHFSVQKYFATFAKDPDAEMAKRYRYVTSWAQFLKAIEDAKAWKAEVEEKAKAKGKPCGRTWLVLDDSYRWRVFAVLRWIELQQGKARKKSGREIEWPAEQEWGLVTQLMTDTLNVLKVDFNLAIIHRLKDEYIKGTQTGETVLMAYPSGIDYIGDITLQIEKETLDTGKRRRYIKVIWNRFEDDCCDNPILEIKDRIEPLDVLKALQTPTSYI